MKYACDHGQKHAKLSHGLSGLEGNDESAQEITLVDKTTVIAPFARSLLKPSSCEFLAVFSGLMQAPSWYILFMFHAGIMMTRTH